MTKLNLIKTYQSYYNAGTKPELVTFDKIPYLTISGKGAPAEAEFVNKIQALYPMAYGLKKYYKEKGMDFGVPKLEGLWWVTKDKPALEGPREEWCWKLMIRMPDFVKKEVFLSIQPEVAEKKKNDLIPEIKFEEILESQCVQMMHVGPYSTEPETIDAILNFMDENGLKINGLHHEIYLSDPRKTAPEKMKTIIRYPVK
ncbi:MAG: GyrI-like domain-containing protein [Candidatus Marinimicrobia bacterium]|nr:GyrI-like domain-containing protein [Candidatus Neomarinimicrobiota bacterium]